jgi:hypothetical protein
MVWYSSLYDSSIYAGVQHVGDTAYGGYYYGVDNVYDLYGAENVESRNWVRDSTTDLQLAGNYYHNEMDWYCACPCICRLLIMSVDRVGEI